MKLFPLTAAVMLLLLLAVVALVASANRTAAPFSGAAVSHPPNTAPQIHAPLTIVPTPSVPTAKPAALTPPAQATAPPLALPQTALPLPLAATNAPPLPLDAMTPDAFTDEGRPRRAARYLVTQRLWNAWIEITSARQAQGKTTPPCNLILLNADEQGRAYRSEIEALFPQGRSHLPNVLQPRQYYCTTPDCSRRVQYFGKSRQDGFTFIVLRWAQTGENLLTENP